jgi:hypothetical protein
MRGRMGTRLASLHQPDRVKSGTGIAFVLAETVRMMEEIVDAARAVLAPEHPAGMPCVY